MSSKHFHNQFENAFVPTRLGSWEVPKETKTRTERKTKKKVTIPVVDSNYRLVGERKKGVKVGGLSGFVGTWDLPKKLPSKSMDNPTGRNKSAYEDLQKEYEEGRKVISGKLPFKGSKKKNMKNGSNEIRTQSSSNHFYEEAMEKGYMTMEGANDGCYVGSRRYADYSGYEGKVGGYEDGFDGKACYEEQYRNERKNFDGDDDILNSVPDRCGSVVSEINVVRRSVMEVEDVIVEDTKVEDDNREFDFKMSRSNQGGFNYNGVGV